MRPPDQIYHVNPTCTHTQPPRAVLRVSFVRVRATAKRKISPTRRSLLQLYAAAVPANFLFFFSVRRARTQEVRACFFQRSNYNVRASKSLYLENGIYLWSAHPRVCIFKLLFRETRASCNGKNLIPDFCLPCVIRSVFSPFPPFFFLFYLLSE